MAAIFTERERRPFEKAVAVTVGIENLEKDKIGAGVIINRAGLVLTAEHVIKGAINFCVKRYRLPKTFWLPQQCASDEASLLDADPTADIALVKLRHSPTNIRPARLGRSSELKVGMPLRRIGRDDNPLMTGHLLKFYQEKNLPWFEVSMVEGEGGSGGPIFNLKGEVVGLMLMGATSEIGKVYALEIDFIKSWLRHRLRCLTEIP